MGCDQKDCCPKGLLKYFQSRNLCINLEVKFKHHKHLFDVKNLQFVV